MFTTLRERLFLAIYIFLILSVPVGSYLYSEKSHKTERLIEESARLQPITKGPSTGEKAVKGLTQANLLEYSKISSPPKEYDSTVITFFGPTLAFAAELEGRPKNNQTSRLFVGILEGEATSNPRFLLSFTLNLPQSGQFSDLSLAGLEPGKSYTAILKGAGQIATSSAFVMSPIRTLMNSGYPLTLTSGDLNDDNIIDDKDYSLIQNSLGATKNNGKWNENADFNSDRIINTLDLAIIIKNIGKAGVSGPWVSPDNTSISSIGGIEATNSATFPEGSANPPVSKSPDGKEGYWIWIPK